MLDATRKARKADYLRLVAAASEVVMNSRSGSIYAQSKSGANEYVEVEFPYFIKFQRGFPKGTLIEKTKTSNIYRINAVRLLDWLHSNGYSKYTATQIVMRTRGYEQLERSVDKMFDLI